MYNSTTSTTPNNNRIIINKYKLDTIKKNPYLGLWKVLYFELNDERNTQSKLNVQDVSIKLDLDSIDSNNDETEVKKSKRLNEHSNDENEEDDLSESSEDEDDDSDSDNENQKVGDLKWNYKPDNNYHDLIMPLFECNLFQFDTRANILKMSSKMRLNFEFLVKFQKPSQFKNDTNSDFMILTSSQVKFSIICQRISNIENFDKQYNFCNMFNNEFLADVTIKNSNGRIFYAHKSIVMLTLKENTDKFLNELNEFRCNSELIELILYYLYNDCLPDRFEFKSNDNEDFILEETRLKSFIEFVKTYKELQDLNVIIQAYLNNFSFKLVTDKLINEIKQCCESINNKIKINDTSSNLNHIFSNPTKLLQITKQSFEQLALAIIKSIRLLDLYSNKQDQLSKDEKIEFIKKIKNCMPFFLEQLKKFLKSLHKQCQNSSEENRREIAEYMVQELDNLVDFLLNLIKISEDVTEKMYSNKKSNSKKSQDDDESFSISDEDDQFNESSNKNCKKNNLKYKLGKSINNAIHYRELKKIQKLNERMRKSFKNLEHILQKYQKTNQNSKSNLIFKELSNFTENIVHDVPSIMLKMDDQSIKKKIESNKFVKLKDFRFGFKLISAKTAWLLNELRNNKTVINPFINKLTKRLNSSDFNQEIDKLRLCDANFDSEKSTLNVNLDSFFKSKSANNNRLAIEAASLYKSKNLADILLEIVDDQTNEVRLIKIHGALVASRCVWFQRALNSGMQEAINRKVVLHDSNLKLFDKFIEYIYTGSLNGEGEECSSFENDDLIQLLTLADKYECDSLKNLIEVKLMINVGKCLQFKKDKDVLIELVDFMELSQTFNLTCLMDLAVANLVDKMFETETGLDNELFENMEDILIKKINERFAFLEKKRQLKSNPKCSNTRRLNDLLNDDSSDDEVIFQEPSDINNNIYTSNIIENIETNSRLEQLINYAHPLIVVDAHLLEDSFVQLKEIVGIENEIPLSDEDLVKLLVRYDCDLNRVIPIVLNCE